MLEAGTFIFLGNCQIAFQNSYVTFHFYQRSLRVSPHCGGPLLFSFFFKKLYYSIFSVWNWISFFDFTLFFHKTNSVSPSSCAFFVHTENQTGTCVFQTGAYANEPCPCPNLEKISTQFLCLFLNWIVFWLLNFNCSLCILNICLLSLDCKCHQNSHLLNAGPQVMVLLEVMETAGPGAWWEAVGHWEHDFSRVDCVPGPWVSLSLPPDYLRGELLSL